jgi:hypothetical protein
MNEPSEAGSFRNVNDRGLYLSTRSLQIIEQRLSEARLLYSPYEAVPAIQGFRLPARQRPTRARQPAR